MYKKNTVHRKINISTRFVSSIEISQNYSLYRQKNQYYVMSIWIKFSCDVILLPSPCKPFLFTRVYTQANKFTLNIFKNLHNFRTMKT